MRFTVKLGGHIVGYSELEGGDPPMGVASGKFVPTAAYEAIQPYCLMKQADGPEGMLTLEGVEGLTIEMEGGEQIECSGGVHIMDFSIELGEPLIEVHVNGIPYPQYGEIFPHHVDAYNNQFPPT
jgi:hypothetical protein